MLADLERTYTETTSQMTAYKAELDNLQTKIERGDKLITGLSGEKTRWEATLITLEDQLEKQVGDCLLGAAFMSYCGPFPSEYRDSLIANWVSQVEVNEIPLTQGFDFSSYMADAATTRSW